ncbi:twin-arginine translocase subunit TatC [Falsirhodobacter halotolerans]|uniref:twin-arginine translocase subunit TatC n=1 Tax=Falsirhodobacter halotolerans TaxID=1146892 RepID=UPI001FD308C9|nr:twin-arginine translocase subunit TatC [Falsirhodobacter halotolerans]MCJ8140178.1 twin-arginine translocase subunit TatC [Falsirhodobacter halotolerans]
MTQSADDIDDSSAPLIEHLKELRSRVIWALAAYIAAVCLVFPFANQVFNFLSFPVCNALAKRGQECGLIMIRLQEGFFVSVNIAFFGGLVVAFPIIAFQLWRFVAPGLYRSEKSAFLPFLIASPVMFFLGAAFSYYVVLPIAFDFFLTFQQAQNAPPSPQVGEVVDRAAHAGIVFQGSAQEYLGLTMKFIMAFGLCFQLPVLLTLMGKAGIISSAGLVSVRKYAIVAILALSAVATPPDMMSQVILFGAVYPLYEVSIFLIRRIEKRREAELRAEGLWFEDEEIGTDVTDSAKR